MIRAQEIGKESTPVEFSLTVVDAAELLPKPAVQASDAVRSLAAHEVNLSASQVLVGSLAALCTVGVLLWAFMKLWLFER